LGYVFTPGNPVAVANPGLQSNTEGDSIYLLEQATDWASTSAGTFTAVGLPAGLSINPFNGLISGVIASGDALAGPYFVTATYTDALGNSNSTTFEWTVSDSLRVDYPGNQSGAEGDQVYLPIQADGYGSGGAGGIYDATGLPNGLSIDAATGLISGTLAAGAADAGPYFVTGNK
jgi:hypothetical protein